MIFPNLVPRVSHLAVLLSRPEDGKMRDPGNEAGFFFGLASELLFWRKDSYLQIYSQHL